MPQISKFYGIIIMMFFDDHNPPHFHVQYNEHRAIINIANGMVNGQLPRRVLSMVFEWLDQHKEELMENWDRLKAGKEPLQILPLD
ncbi:MAG: DUF4160 domain-containing protein [Muribaculaceae bacterium]|nr:DUF4160 domain-containing protein [Muribaculaceae bacterium]